MHALFFKSFYTNFSLLFYLFILPQLTDFPKSQSLLDFIYLEHTVTKGAIKAIGLPSIYGDDLETLCIKLKDRVEEIYLYLYYIVSDKEDFIVRFNRIENKRDDDIILRSLFSFQLDLPTSDYSLMTFDGAWAREREIHLHPLREGRHINESRNGVSGSFHNSAIALLKSGASDDAGDVYGFNLIYSSNHQESVEVNGYSRTRVLSGINPDTFSYIIHPNESFDTPQAVIAYSSSGLNGLSEIMHNFVKKHVVRGYWRDRERPILINNWEATYFNFNEEKLISLIKKAKDAGIELFVLDDGWFGNRNDDRSSLGDWFVNKNKLPSGLRYLSDTLHDNNMLFGIWVEPEMISEDSLLYQSHPDWMLKAPNRNPSIGRNQYILDLTKKSVVGYLYESLSSLFTSSNCDYVKWDMNRFFSDINAYDNGCKISGEFFHRYALGLYDLLERLTKKHPKILFEGCSSGGNRFDLGILSYMSQIWTSDNTDIHMRMKIQEGTSIFYPLSVMANHVSASPNHQTLRVTSIEDRFNTAIFGLLGYELDLEKISKYEFDIVVKQVEFYKKYRRVFQFGGFKRDKGSWLIKLGDEIFYLVYTDIAPVNSPYDSICIKGLDDDRLYTLETREKAIDFERLRERVSSYNTNESSLKISYEVYGSELSASVTLPPRYSGSGDIRLTRITPDFSSELYHVKEIIT